MAAILPFLENPDDPAETPVQSQALAQHAQRPQRTLSLEAIGRLRDLGSVAPADVLDVGQLTADALDQSHAELINTAWIRKTVEEQLQNRRFVVQARDIKGARPKEVFIILQDGPIVPPGETVVAWNPPASPDAQQFALLSWTSKMGCPSFSLPAGPPTAGGSCPGALGGQSIVPITALRHGARRVQEVIGKPVRIERTICEKCYAEGGQYSTSQVQFAQVLRFIWTREAAKDVRIDSNGRPSFGPRAISWIRAMGYAIENADFLLDGGRVGKIDYPRERSKRKFFRWHDSGDIFSKQYLAMMKAVCNAFPDITFWAPSRIWATEWGTEAVNKINGPADRSNLVIRPSAYHVSEPAPTKLELAASSPDRSAIGWAEGSVAYHSDQKHEGGPTNAKVAHGEGFDWDCQTYAIDDLKESAKHTCRHALAPDGTIGCRACWVRPELRICYTLH